MTCNICAENYNNSTLKKIVCPWDDCKFEACKSCVRRFLVETTGDPCCMNCRKPFEDKFLVDNLNRSYIEKDYKNARKQILLESEMSKLQETMIIAERAKVVKKEELEIKNFNDKISEMKKQLHELTRQKNEKYRRIRLINEGLDPDSTSEPSTSSDRNKFIMNCTKSGCRGFLSSQYKCGICENWTCPHCLELIGPDKNVPHTCNPDNVASAQMIKKETKPCPKCAVPIFKISGCSQMWCTECKIAFDYNTLKIVTGGHIHNPHYYQYMRENGMQARNPGDIPCGGLVAYHTFTRIVGDIFNWLDYDSMGIKFERKVFDNMHRYISHITYNDLPRLRRRVTDLQDHQSLRVSYILGEISKDEFKDKVFRQDKERKISQKILQISELMSTVGIENCRLFAEDGNRVCNQLGFKIRNNRLSLSQQSFKNLDSFKWSSDHERDTLKTNIKNFSLTVLDIYNRMEAMKKYCIKELGKISITYNRSVITIDNNWNFSYKKYLITEKSNLED